MLITKYYLENTKPPHNKFYEIRIEYSDIDNHYILYTRYGKIATSGIELETYKSISLTDITFRVDALKALKINRGYIIKSVLHNTDESEVDSSIEDKLINSIKKTKILKKDKIAILERKFSIYPEGRFNLILND